MLVLPFFLFARGLLGRSLAMPDAKSRSAVSFLQSEHDPQRFCPHTAFKWITPLDYGAAGDGEVDDSVAVAKAFQAASADCVGLLVPAKNTFKVMPGAVKVQLNNAVVRFDGTIVGPTLDEWNPKHGRWPAGSCAYGERACAVGVDPEASRSMYTLLEMVNSYNVSLTGTGRILGRGLPFWKIRKRKPEVRAYCLLKIADSDLVSVRGLRLENSPLYHASIPRSSRVLLQDLYVELTGKEIPTMERMNTDGVSIGPESSHVTLEGGQIASGDDNIVVKQGSSFITVRGVTLKKGKGISIGSLGERRSEGSVQNCLFDDIRLHGSQHGARIKTWRGGRGIVSNMTFSNFFCKHCGTGILVDQNYCPPSQRPEGCARDTDHIRISGVTFESFSGTATKIRSMNCHGCDLQEVDNLLVVG